LVAVGVLGHETGRPRGARVGFNQHLNALRF
jgi:hypothetical protein